MKLYFIIFTVLVLFELNSSKSLPDADTTESSDLIEIEKNQVEENEIEPTNSTRNLGGMIESKYLDEFYTKETDSAIRGRINNWKPENGGNIWELSGLLEGDIQTPRGRNAVRNPYARWPCGIIPYTFEYGSFSTAQTNLIYQAINEYHTHTCLRFHPKKSTDYNYIEFTSRYAGCWASVGMQGGKQNVNLQSPACVTYATAVHEIMHAIGFYHSHSASNRDSYVQINWNNIQQGQEHNFDKFSDNQVTDFGVQYDYYSILHYSSNAFSKNGYATIEPRYRGYTIGNANHLSSGDLEKIKRMYQQECSRHCHR